MIQILPLREKEVLDQLNQQENCNASFAFCLYDGKEMTGYVLYDVKDDCGLFALVRGENEADMDGLVRSALASLLDRGISEAEFSCAFDKAFLQKWKLLKPNEDKIKSILTVLHHCEGCSGDCNHCAK